VTWDPPVLNVSVALESTPMEWPTYPDDFTDYSDRLLSFTMDRGRQDELGEFDPGTCQIVLDNSDRKLDAAWFYADNYHNLDKGLPGCHVRVTATWASTDYPVFYGYLGPEGWPPAKDYGQGSTVTLQAYDWLAIAGQLALPSSPWAAQVTFMSPPWWIRGNSVLSANPDTGTFWDEGSLGIDAVVGADPGVYVAQVSSLVEGDDDPAMYFDALTSAVGSAVTQDDNWIQVYAVFQTNGNLGLNVEGPIVCCVNGSDFRWRIYLKNGLLYLAHYDSAGTLLNTYTGASNPNDAGGRWDDGEPHLVLWYKPGSTSTTLLIDAVGTNPSLSTSALYGGDVVIAGGTEPITVDEVIVGHFGFPALPNPLVDLWNHAALPFHDEELVDRVTTLVALAGEDSLLSNFYVLHAVGDTETFWGADKMPSTLLEGLQGAAADRDGAVYVLRDGYRRIRTGGALSDSSFAATFQTITANFTNDPTEYDAVSPDILPLARGVVERTGTRLDRVINYAQVSLPWGYPGDTNPSGVVKVTYQDPTSIARYGRRRWSRDTGNRDPLTATAAAVSRVTRYANPPIEIKELPLPVWGDDDAVGWLLADCELEKAVMVTDVPNEQDSSGGPIGDPWRASFNVQGEHWRWEQGTDWTVTLDLARNGADDPP